MPSSDAPPARSNLFVFLFCLLRGGDWVRMKTKMPNLGIGMRLERIQATIFLSSSSTYLFVSFFFLFTVFSFCWAYQFVVVRCYFFFFSPFF